MHRSFYERVLRAMGVACGFVFLMVLGHAYALSVRFYMLKEVHIKDATFQEAVDYLRERSRMDDNFERDPGKRGANLIIKDPNSRISLTKRASLELHDVKVSDAVQLVAKLFDVRVKTEPFAFVFFPKDEPEELYMRFYKVPPDFLRTPLR